MDIVPLWRALILLQAIATRQIASHRLGFSETVQGTVTFCQKKGLFAQRIVTPTKGPIRMIRAL